MPILRPNHRVRQRQFGHYLTPIPDALPPPLMPRMQPGPDLVSQQQAAQLADPRAIIARLQSEIYTLKMASSFRRIRSLKLSRFGAGQLNSRTRRSRSFVEKLVGTRIDRCLTLLLSQIGGNWLKQARMCGKISFPSDIVRQRQLADSTHWSDPVLEPMLSNQHIQSIINLW